MGVTLSRVDENDHNLGVLGRIEGNRPQLLYVPEDQQNLAWDRCKNKPALAAEFVEKFIAQLFRKISEVDKQPVCLWKLDQGTWKCALELRPHTGTVVWLDAASRTLKVKGPDWPFWQLCPSDEQVRHALGETIAAFGPMAHEQLANADEWQFLPRDDIRSDAD
ncbi:MAG: hypothetical protein FWE88_07005 [Phycisphaerae bacterium]|nr:hypothetical protein [Phycisphaerae bacterium]